MVGSDTKERRGKQASENREFIYTGQLAWWPIKGHPFRWTPAHGNPECVGEKVIQTMFVHRVMLYIATVVTIILIVSVFDIHLAGG